MLEKASDGRVTAATAMNMTSSRQVTEPTKKQYDACYLIWALFYKSSMKSYPEIKPFLYRYGLLNPS